jgi:O-succinylbenzoic acid--CoA ligase
MLAGTSRLWLGPFDPPTSLPDDFTDTALVVPTSGSTGIAKAVALTRTALQASQDATALFFAREIAGDPDVRGAFPGSDGHGFWLPLLPPTHIAGIQVLARAVRTAQVHGRDRVPLPDPLPDLSTHFEAAAFTRAASPALEQASVLGLPAFTSLVPTQLRRILEDPTADGARARSQLGRFAAVLVGGAATSLDLLARARGSGIRIRTTYGSSETAGGCVYDRRPLPGVDLQNTDPDPDGVGRLRVHSPTLAIGYLNADGSGDRFGPEREERGIGPAGPGFLTSDLARIDDGELTIIGRADDVIITGGRKVVPQDVERAIERSPMVRELVADAVVVGVPDAEWGTRVDALVVPSLVPAVPAVPTAAALPSVVRAALRTGPLPSYMVPRAIHVVPDLPRLGIGKVDRAAAAMIADRLGREEP